jgi:hypothetical protein
LKKIRWARAGTDESNVEQMQAERTRLFMVPPPILANHIKNAMVRGKGRNA